MQIFWISGPVGKIHSFNLSLKKVVFAFSLLGIVLLATGSALQFLGFRMALEYDPQIARQLGNLHTAVELENLNMVYQTRLQQLEQEQQSLMRMVSELTLANKRMVEIFTPKSLLSIKPKAYTQGGSYLPITAPPPRGKSILDATDYLHEMTQRYNKYLISLIAYWQSEAEWLESLPLGSPVSLNPAKVSSLYGERSDPFTHHRTFHGGIDFEIPEGTPVLASGNGTVTLARYDTQFGNTLIIRHRDGFSSRYAHANKLLVKEGSVVSKGQHIASSGNTGRSTGAHLHYEILKNNQTLDPALYLIALSRAKQ